MTAQSRDASKKMTHRQRVLLALDHQEPDRVPMSLFGTAQKPVDSLCLQLCQYFGLAAMPKAVRQGTNANLYNEELIEKLDTDFKFVHLKRVASSVLTGGVDFFTDEWGITYQKSTSSVAPVGHPLANAQVSELRNYRWPNPHHEERTRGLREEAHQLYEKGDYAIVAHRPIPAGLLELACWLQGTEEFLTRLILDKRYATTLLDHLLEVFIGFYDILLTAVGDFVDIVEMCDDYGSQRSLLISPCIFRDLLKPREAQLIAFIKKKVPKAKVFFHSDGAVRPLIGDFIDIGIDILHPIQPLAWDMDSQQLKQEFGKRICFQGAIDVQEALCGTVEQVKDEVKHRIDALAAGGGYILAPSNAICDDVPLQNVLAIFEAAKTYGQYPVGD